MFRRIFIIIIVSYISISAQEITTGVDSTGESFFNKKFISAAGVSGIYIGTIIDSYYTWWQDDKRPFTLLSGDWFDKNADNGIDKLGHFYTSYLFYKVQKNLFLWGGYSESTAKTLSASLSMLMALIIEVGDGFSRYGFDYKDFVFNTGGLGYAVLQDEIPYLKNFNVKWSYIPTAGFSFPPRFSHHYEGHIYWLTFNIHGIVSPFTDTFWPEYIQPAVGYSIGKNSESEYILGVDINLLPLFRSDDPVIEYIGDIINLFHIPSPGIKFTERRKPQYELLLLN